MEKVMRLVPGGDMANPADKNTPTDWNKCLFCQEDTSDKLRCPADFADRFQGAGYTSIAESLTAFNDLGCLPAKLKLSRLDDGDGLQQTFSRRKAKFHKSCSLKFNQTELKRASKRKQPSDDGRSSSGAKEPFTRQQVFRSDDNCFFCDEPVTTVKPVHEASTFDLETRVRQCALNLQDENLLAKLSQGDMIATEAKYHMQCLVSLYNRDRDRPRSSQDDCDTNIGHSTAFALLISYIQTVVEDEEVAPVFQLSALKKLYTDRVDQLGGDSTAVHSTRFKNKILSYFPQLQAHSEGRELLLVADKNVGQCLKTACKLDDDSEAVFLFRAANIVRRDMMSKKGFPINGSFTEDCQENSVAQSLLMLVTMILYGTNIKGQASYLSQPALSLSQLLTYNSCVRRRQTSSTIRHSEQRETPLPLFLGALVHSKTRSRELVDTLYRLGLSVSYDRVLGMSADLGNSAISHFQSVGTVCPPTLNIGVFTTSAVDNIDHDPTATSAHGSFHGTGISLFQHPDNDNRGTEQTRVAFSKSGKKVNRLPDSYTLLPVTLSPRKNLLFLKSPV